MAFRRTNRQSPSLQTIPEGRPLEGGIEKAFYSLHIIQNIKLKTASKRITVDDYSAMDENDQFRMINTAIKELHSLKTPARPQELQKLTTFIQLYKGQDIDITTNRCDDTMLQSSIVSAILQGLQSNKNVTILNFSECRLTKESALIIADILPYLSSVQEIFFTKNKLTDGSIELLVDAICKLRNIRKVYFSDNKYTDSGAQHTLRQLLTKETLKELHLGRNNNLTHNTLFFLANLLKEPELQKPLPKIVIYSTKFDQTSFKAVAEAIEKNPYFIDIEIGIEVCDPSIKAVCEKNQSILKREREESPTGIGNEGKKPKWLKDYEIACKGYGLPQRH
ncbi:MAG: hypothetical protein AAF195_01545 [Pseudomonadota bacterium]